MNANRKSDEFVLPTTSANKGATEASAELIEERNSAKRNTKQATLPRTLSRNERKSRGLFGVRESVLHTENVFALDSRQEPYEVILHVRICARGPR